MSEVKKERNKVQKCVKTQLTRKRKQLKSSTPPLTTVVDPLSAKNSLTTESYVESQVSLTGSSRRDRAHSSFDDAEWAPNSCTGNRPPYLTRSFLDLNVKIFTQPLGLSRQWTEYGSGCVEFSNWTIRVKAPGRPGSNDTKTSITSLKDGETTFQKKTIQGTKRNDTSVEAHNFDRGKSVSFKNNMRSIFKKRENSDGQKADAFANTLAKTCDNIVFIENDSDSNRDDEEIILEDTITSETTFVGENYSIVWNSLEKQLSLCLMFDSVSGYVTSWSALIAMQGKAYPRFEVDFLRDSVLEALDDIKDSERKISISDSSSPFADEQHQPQTQPQRLPYTLFIHDEYVPPLGFIEKHFISLCLMHFGHITFPELYEDNVTIFSLLGIANEDLVEELLSDAAYPLLIKGLGCTYEPKAWSVPDGLSNLTVSPVLASIISKDLRATHLLSIVESLPIKTEFFEKLNIVTKRLRNEIMCALLSTNEVFDQIKKALEIVPPLNALHEERSVFIDSESLLNSLGHDSIATLTNDDPIDDSVIQDCRRVQQQVFANLRFLRSCVTLGINELGRDSVGPVVVKVFEGGILESLSIVAERYAMPRGATLGFLEDPLACSHSGVNSCRSIDHPPASSSSNWYSKPIERELNSLLNATIISLNEEWDEQLMNEIVRSPILANPHKFNGLMVFMLRQLVFSPGSRSLVGGQFSLHDSSSPESSLAIFHVLGLHDNESSISIGRPISPKCAEIRNRFHRYFILNYLLHATSGSLLLNPLLSTTESAPNNLAIPTKRNQSCFVWQDLPECVSPPLIFVLDYFITLMSPENRELILKSILGHKGRVLQFVEKCCRVATDSVKSQRLVGMDVLCINVRFIKTILEYVGGSKLSKEQPTLSETDPLSQTLSQNLVTFICRKLIFESDVFGSILRAYQMIGGRQQNTMFHSAVLSVFDVIEKGALKAIDNVNDNICNLRDFLFLKHFEVLPDRYARRFREALLSRTSRCLGFNKSPDVGESMSGLIFVSSDIPHSTSELRFVDEIEASSVKMSPDLSLRVGSPINRSQEGASHMSEGKFLTILRTRSEHWAQSNHFNEDLKRFTGISSSAEQLLEPAPVSPPATQEGLVTPLVVPPMHIPPPVLSGDAYAPPARSGLSSPPVNSLATRASFHVSPTPPKTKNPANSRGRSHSSSALDVTRYTNTVDDQSSDATSETFASKDNVKTDSFKNATKRVQSLPDEHLTLNQGIYDSNTVDDSFGLLNNLATMQRKNSNSNISSILTSKANLVLPFLKKPSPSAL